MKSEMKSIIDLVSFKSRGSLSKSNFSTSSLVFKQGHETNTLCSKIHQNVSLVAHYNYAPQKVNRIFLACSYCIILRLRKLI